MTVPSRSVEGLDTVLVWLRRDLRLYDNPALVCALQSAKCVIPVYIHAPEEDGQFQLGRSARWWLKQTVRNIANDLKGIGSRLIVRRSRSGEALQTIIELLQETGAQGLFFNHLYDAISLTRDHDVKMAVENAGTLCRSFNSELLYEPWEVLDDSDEPFVTFMDFWNRVISMPHPPSYPLPPPNWMPAVPAQLASKPIDEVDFFQSTVQEGSVEQLKYRWDASTAAGHARLEAFLEAVLPNYDHERAKVDRSSTSQMSPWLHLGSVSQRYVYYRVVSRHAELLRNGQDCTASCLQFLQQLGYREYSRYLSFHFPFIAERSLLAHLRACPSRPDQNRFKAWKKGQTGYPLVDAAMRQLWSNGWMHNRLRVVVASFLVKNLLLPWQWGLKHMWDAQIDADLEMDALGWQYVAGCLVDGHPFSYMLDLDVESKRFDPDGQYVRQWLPVLALLPTEYVHHPWLASEELLEEAGVELGFNYPRPIVSKEESMRDVHWANSVIERCTSTSASGGINNNSRQGGSSGSGIDARNNDGDGAEAERVAAKHEQNKVAGPAAGMAAFQLTGGAAAPQPHKQPYKPPTDPAIQAAFLRAPGGVDGGYGGGNGSGSSYLEALNGVVPDLAGLRLPEHLYRRNHIIDLGERVLHRGTRRRHGMGSNRVQLRTLANRGHAAVSESASVESAGAVVPRGHRGMHQMHACSALGDASRAQQDDEMDSKASRSQQHSTVSGLSEVGSNLVIAEGHSADDSKMADSNAVAVGRDGVALPVDTTPLGGSAARADMELSQHHDAIVAATAQGEGAVTKEDVRLATGDNNGVGSDEADDVDSDEAYEHGYDPAPAMGSAENKELALPMPWA